MPTIKIPQKSRTIDVEAGANLMKSILNAGLPVASSCNGDGVCSKCKMTVTEEPPFADGTALEKPLSPPGEIERFLLTKFKLKSPLRISCQVQVTCDISVETTYW